MKKIRDVMISHFPIATNSMSVRAALSSMREHGIKALPVVEDDALRGIVDYVQLSGYHPNRLLCDVQVSEPIIASPEMSMAAAYEMTEGSQNRHLLVVEDGQLVGILSPDLVQANLGISVDPLTGLPWANALRERAIAFLMQSQEIVILFMDMDNFRYFNKDYGHVVADRAIVAVAKAIQDSIDPVTDLACRYGGDEFAVVTARRLEEAEKLAEKIRENVSGTVVDGIDRQLSISIGIRGGRRTKEREGIHYAATVDDLMNLASKASTAAKAHANGSKPPTEQTSTVYEGLIPESGVPALSGVEGPVLASPRIEGIRPTISGLKLRSFGSKVEVEVKLTCGDVIRTGTATGTANAQAIMRLVVEATLQATNLFLPEGYVLAPESVERVGIGDDKNIVVTTVIISGPDGVRLLAGAVAVRQDLYRTVVEATLHAVNRVVTRPSFAARRITAKKENYLA